MKSIVAIALSVLISVAVAAEIGEFVKVNRNHKRRPFKIIPRIVSGRVAEQNDYPYHALVIAEDEAGTSRNCNGAILNENWIISVADCIEKAENIRILIGSTKYHNPLLTVLPDAYVAHPHFTPYDNNKNNIALLRLPASETLRFPDGPNPSFAPIRLPRRQQQEESFADYLGHYSGFGTSDPYTTGPSEYLRYAETKIIPNYSCAGYFQNNYDLINSDVICAKTIDTRQGACSGDGGAPLVVNEYGTNTLVGLLSVLHYNGDCGRQSVPAAFTRITSHFEWIRSITNYQFRP